MTRTVIIASIISLFVLIYLCLGVYSKKPGMNGFSVTNGMIKLLITGKDYIKVGEDRYLYREGSLGKIIKNEYDEYTYIKNYIEMHQRNNEEVPDLEDFYSPSFHNESELLKVSLVIKNGKKLKGHGVRVWQPLTDSCSIYFSPYEEAKP